MIFIKRVNSINPGFRELIGLLDNDLNSRYSKDQEEYDKHNIIEFIETVVVAYSENTPVGCGCFKEYDNSTIEIKRMFVVSEFRGKGISKQILKELESWGKQLGYSKSILETGIKQHEAIGLYSNFGYSKIKNFGQYADMPNSVCFLKYL